jgi:CRP/FNR family transcriptional regulator, cyclic AMP receptor protein
MRSSMQCDIDLAENSGLYRPQKFDELDLEVRSALLEVGRVRTFVAGQPIFEPGTLHTDTYLILQGLVRTYYAAYSGREVTLSYWGDGDVVGGPDFFGGGIHVWGGVALRSTRTVAISGPKLNALAVRNPKVAIWIAQVAMFKLKWISLLFQLHGTESVSQRLPHLLVMLSELHGVREGDTVVIRHPLSQSDLATLLGTSRQWTNKAMVELKQRNLLRTEDGRIIIIDLPTLKELARGER